MSQYFDEVNLKPAGSEHIAPRIVLPNPPTLIRPSSAETHPSTATAVSLPPPTQPTFPQPEILLGNPQTLRQEHQQQHGENKDASPQLSKQPINVDVSAHGARELASNRAPEHNSPPPIYTAFYPPGTYPATQVPPAYELSNGGGGPARQAYIIDASGLNGMPAYIIRGDNPNPVFIISAPYNEMVRRKRALTFLSFFLLLFPLVIFLIIMLHSVH